MAYKTQFITLYRQINWNDGEPVEIIILKTILEHNKPTFGLSFGIIPLNNISFGDSYTAS